MNYSGSHSPVQTDYLKPMESAMGCTDMLPCCLKVRAV